MAPTRARNNFKSPALIVILTCTLLSVGIRVAGSAPPAPSSGPVPVLVSVRSDIRSYLRLPGDQVVEVPDGTYTGGNVTAPHPQTAGPLKGWLVLVAENPHGVVVDLSSGMLNLYPTTSRIMFVGFKFTNGMVKVTGADNIRFWYTEHTFPASEWYRQWVAAGGGHNVSQAQGLAAMNTMANPRPKAISIRNYQSDTANSIELYGADIHDVGDDGLNVQGSDIRVEGARIWNVDEQGADPGYGGAQIPLLSHSAQTRRKSS